MTTPASDEIDAVLAQTEMFADLPDATRKQLASACRMRTLPRGQFVFGQDDPGDSLIVVAHGRVKVVVRTADGGELLLTVVNARETVGELSIVDGGTRSADAETLEESRLVFVPRDALLALMQSEPTVSGHILRTLAGILRRLTDATADLVFLDLPRRIAKLLLEQPRADDGTVDLGLTQTDLAHRVGSTRQSVNASLRMFERRGWLELHGQKIVLREVDALARFSAR